MNVTDFHNKAMEFAERAFMARVQGSIEESTKLFEKALENELAAICKLEADVRIEPTYSVLHRSAGTLAIDCNQPQKALESRRPRNQSSRSESTTGNRGRTT